MRLVAKAEETARRMRLDKIISVFILSYSQPSLSLSLREGLSLPSPSNLVQPLVEFLLLSRHGAGDERRKEIDRSELPFSATRVFVLRHG